MTAFGKFAIGLLAAISISIPATAGLDVYAGPLSKFYKNDYLSTQAMSAKELGMEFNTVYPDGEPKWLTRKNADKKIRKFRAKVTKQGIEKSPNIGEWSEVGDDYYIEQLNWDSLAALVHLTSYAMRPDLERPKEFTGDNEVYPAYSEAFDKGYYFGPLLILECDLFLPADGEAVFNEENPLGEEIAITTTANLKRTLNFLDTKIWEGQVEPDVWFERGPANIGSSQEIRISDETGKPEIVEVEYPPLQDAAKHNAEYAYSVLHKVLEYAEKHNVPIAMDG